MIQVGRLRSAQVVIRRHSTALFADRGDNRRIAVWLLGTSGAVAGMVAVGGATRLTRSGLSMTDWKLTGSLPPMNDDEWMEQFNIYKRSPEGQQRKTMTLEEFKVIYWWEYGHRMLGRTVGLLYAVPFAIFAARRMIPSNLYPRLILLLGLGGTQGLIGWWMVKSGLDADPASRREIRVSPYRLATHLGMAFTTYSLLLWTGLDLLNYPRTIPNALSSSARQLRSLRQLGLVTLSVTALTAISGAFVAGNDAGRAYNSWPKMGDEWIPSGLFELRPFYRNFFENTATVQFDHRMLAYTTTLASTATYVYAYRTGLMPTLPPTCRFALRSMMAMTLAQVTLGITTLLLYVPIPLGVTHQAGSLALLSLSTWFVHSMRFAKYLKYIR